MRNESRYNREIQYKIKDKEIEKRTRLNSKQDRNKRIKEKEDQKSYIKYLVKIYKTKKIL